MPEPSNKRVLSPHSPSDSTSSKKPKLASIFEPKQSTPPGKWLKDLKHHKISKGCGHFIWGEPKGSSKIAAFDIDGTVIKPREGRKHPKSDTDWEFWSNRVLAKIRQAHADGYAIVLLSNQAGNPAQRKWFRNKLSHLGRALKVPFHAYAAHDYDIYRKPGVGMWMDYAENFNEGIEIDLSRSFYVGDAAGRPKDHNDTDRKMAMNVGLSFFTPEEYFHDQPLDSNYTLSGFDVKSYDHSQPLFSPTSTPLLAHRRSEFDEEPPLEVVIFVGSPGAGKTSFYQRHFASKGYVHINQDTLKTREKCLSKLVETLSSSSPKSCIIDNTSPSSSTRRLYTSELKINFPHVKIRCFVFTAPRSLCMHNSVYRATYEPIDRGNGVKREMLPVVAFDRYWNQFEEPSLDEGRSITSGFSEIKQINFQFEGTTEQRKNWENWLVECYHKNERK